MLEYIVFTPIKKWLHNNGARSSACDALQLNGRRTGLERLASQLVNLLKRRGMLLK